MFQRPPNSRINPHSPLAQGLIFAGLGQFPGSKHFHDACGNHAGTLTGYTGAANTPSDQWKWDSYLRRWALGLVATGDYVTASLGANPTRFSIATWVQRTDNGTGGAVVLSEDDATSNRNWQLKFTTTNNYPQFTTLGPTKSVVGTVGLGNAIWYHLCGVFDGAFIYLYMNGAQVAVPTATTSVATATTPLLIGRLGSAESPLTGLVADVLKFNRALSPNEVAVLADPANVELRLGNVPLILDPRRCFWPAYTPPAVGGFKPYWARRRSAVIAGGVI